MQNRVRIVAHGRLRSNSSLSEVGKQLDAQIFYTEFAGHAVQLAATHGRECEILVVAGGDGSINEVVNGVMSIDADQQFALFHLVLETMSQGHSVLRVTPIQL